MARRVAAVYPAAVQIPRYRRLADELPLPADDAAAARPSPRRRGTDSRSVRQGHRATIPLLQLRRRDAHPMTSPASPWRGIKFLVLDVADRNRVRNPRQTIVLRRKRRSFRLFVA